MSIFYEIEFAKYILPYPSIVANCMLRPLTQSKASCLEKLGKKKQSQRDFSRCDCFYLFLDVILSRNLEGDPLFPDRFFDEALPKQRHRHRPC